MSKVPRLKGVMYTTPELYNELITNGSITVDGVTYEYDEQMIYITDSKEKSVVNSINGKVGDVQFDSADLTDGNTLLHTTDVGTGAGKIPVLSSNGKLDENLLPAVALTDIYEANSEVAMLALNAQKGDICIRTDLNKTFVLRGTPASALSNWLELRTPTDTVLSVNGKTGAVVLSSSDLTDGSALAKTIEVDAKLEAAIANTNQNVTELLTNKVDNSVFNNLETRVTTTETDVLELNNSVAQITTLQNTKADKTELPTALNQLTEDSTHRLVTDAEKAAWNSKLDSFTETDPTVPAWAKQATKPEYDYTEIKNVPVIPEGVKLYAETGQNTDGAITQKATTDALNLKADKNASNITTSSWLTKLGTDADSLKFLKDIRKYYKNVFRGIHKTDYNLQTYTWQQLGPNVWAYGDEYRAGLSMSHSGTQVTLTQTYQNSSAQDNTGVVNIKITQLKPNTKYYTSYTVVSYSGVDITESSFFNTNASYGTNGNRAQGSFTTDANGEYAFWCYFNKTTTGTGTVTIDKIMISESSDTTYMPNELDATVFWAGNVEGLPTITLSESMLNFKWIVFYTVADNSYRYCHIYPSQWFRYVCADSYSARCVMSTDSQYCSVYALSDTSIKIGDRASSSKWLVVEGVGRIYED